MKLLGVFELIRKLQYKLLVLWYSWVRRPQPASESFPDESPILVAAPLYLGDLCMALPALALLCQSTPNKKIILLVRPELVSLAKLIDGIDSVVPFFKDLRTLRTIRSFKAGSTICFFEKRLFRFLSASGARNIWAFRDQETPKFFQGPSFDRVSGLPISEMLHSLIKDFLDQMPEGVVSRIPFEKLSRPFWNLSSIEKQRFNLDYERYAVIHLSGRGKFRKLDLDTAIELKQDLIAEGMTPVFTGTEDLLPRELEINSINLIDKTSLPELLLTLAKAEIVFGPDTGVTHLAASLGVRTVVIMGSSQPRLVHSELFFPNRIFQYSGEIACRSTKRLHGYTGIPNGHCKGFQCSHQEQGFCVKGRNQQAYIRLAKEEIHKASAKGVS